MRIISKLAIFFSFFLLFFFFTIRVNAATLTNANDVITTSRPSASSVLTANQAANATTVTVANNGSIFLASDSATFVPDIGETQNTGIIVGSYVSGTGALNFINAVANTHHAGDAVIVPITAMHTITFNTVQAVPSGGHIVITFPGSGVTIASPSATTFSFNGMSTSNPSDVAFNNATCSSVAATAPSIDCTLGSGISAGTTITVLIGCTANTGVNCTASAPRLINPTKTAAAGTGDTWSVTVATQDSGAATLDSVTMKITTIDSVLVSATVDSALSFTIAGISASTALNGGSGSASCGADNTSSGVSTSATTVNLGTFASGNINLAAQKLTVTTNSNFGYVITATSSGRFINPATGFWITDANGGNGLTANDTPAPAVISGSGQPDFGINACGPAVNNTTWAGSSTTAFGSGAKYTNPWNTGNNFYYATIASNGTAVSAQETVIRYAATISGNTPAGTYATVLTYVLTPTF